MPSTIRAAEEDVERLLRLILNDLQNEPASKRDRLAHLIDQITTAIHKLVEGKDNARKDEIAGSNDLRALCDRLKEALGQNGVVATQHQTDDPEQVALWGVKIEKLCEIMSEKIMRPNENVEKKQAQIYEEIDIEMEDEEVPDVDSDDEDQEIYNPLKLPIDSDGNTVPYWLYKLRALGLEFKCEICGNYSWGRRAYERHFKESQHQYAMRQLGMADITFN